MKKIMIIFISLCLLGAFAACSTAADSVSVVPEGVPPTAVTAPQETPPSTSLLETATTSISVETQAVTGTVTDATMNTIEIETADGNIFRFSTEEVPVEGKDGIVVGYTATVYYIGILDTSVDTQDVTVTRIIME